MAIQTTVEHAKIRARLATVDELLEKLVPQYLTPVPSRRAFIEWLGRAGVDRLKANPTAKRGGGACWYHVSQVERLLRQRAGMAGCAEVAR